MAAVLFVGDVVPAREVLENAGFSVVVADDRSVAQVSVLGFDAVIVGEGESEALLHLLQRAAWEQKLIAGIGDGVIALAQAELLEGVHAACPPHGRAIVELDRHGAVRVPGDLVDEGNNLITARDDDAAEALAYRVAARLRPRYAAEAGDFGLA